MLSGDEKRQKKPRQRRDHNDSDATDSTDQHGVYRLPDKKILVRDPAHKSMYWCESYDHVCQKFAVSNLKVYDGICQKKVSRIKGFNVNLKQKQAACGRHSQHHQCLVSVGMSLT